jgi:hypothetical protein
MAATLTGNGITFGDSTQLNSKYGIFPQGCVTLFYQTNAPVGWAKSTTHNDKALRVVSGSGGVSGGSIAFTSAFASKPISTTIPVSGTANAINLTVSQIASHSHPASIQAGGEHSHTYRFTTGNSPNGQSGGSGPVTVNTSPYATGDVTGSAGDHNHSLTLGSTGSSPAPHDHPWSGSGPLSTSLDFSVQYIDVIFASFT